MGEFSDALGHAVLRRVRGHYADKARDERLDDDYNRAIEFEQKTVERMREKADDMGRIEYEGGGKFTKLGTYVPFYESRSERATRIAEEERKAAHIEAVTLKHKADRQRLEYETAETVRTGQPQWLREAEAKKRKRSESFIDDALEYELTGQDLKSSMDAQGFDRSEYESVYAEIQRRRRGKESKRSRLDKEKQAKEDRKARQKELDDLWDDYAKDYPYSPRNFGANKEWMVDAGIWGEYGGGRWADNRIPPKSEWIKWVDNKTKTYFRDKQGSIRRGG